MSDNDNPSAVTPAPREVSHLKSYQALAHGETLAMEFMTPDGGSVGLRMRSIMRPTWCATSSTPDTPPDTFAQAAA